MNSTGKGMPMMDEKTKRFAANSMFPSLIFGALGLILAQAGVAQLGGSWPTYVILGIPGLTLSGLALYRARLHWSAGTAGMPGGAGGVDRRSASATLAGTCCCSGLVSSLQVQPARSCCSVSLRRCHTWCRGQEFRSAATDSSLHPVSRLLVRSYAWCSMANPLPRFTI